MDNNKAKVVISDPDTGLTYTLDFEHNDGELTYNMDSDLGNADKDKPYLVNVLMGVFLVAINNPVNPPVEETPQTTKKKRLAN